MPTGVPTAVAANTMISEPTMALASPPPSAFGGGVDSVKAANDSPLRPRASVSHRIQISHIRPKAIAISDSVSAIWLISLRRRCGAMR
jgi:hypothetical protein